MYCFDDLIETQVAYQERTNPSLFTKNSDLLAGLNISHTTFSLRIGRKILQYGKDSQSIRSFSMTDNALTEIEEFGIQQIDSLSANEFRVELDGEAVLGVFQVTDFTSFKLDVKTTTALKKLQEPFKIVKMVQRDGNNAFNKWIRDTFAAGADIVRPKRTLNIVAVDDGVETRRWTVKGAWISEIKYSDFDSASGELLQETVTVEYDDIEDSWPSSGS